MGRVLVHGFTFLTAPAPSTHGRSALGASEVGLRVTLASVPDWLLSDTTNPALQKGEVWGLTRRDRVWMAKSSKVPDPTSKFWCVYVGVGGRVIHVWGAQAPPHVQDF